MSGGSAVRPVSSRSVSIDGPAGAIEALIDEPADGDESRHPEAIAVVCHPHPQHQGTMHNKVVHTLSRYFARRGMPSVRFNYRGVGDSEGSYAGGDGETDDARAVIAWARARYPGAALHLAGFSFGGMVAIRAALAEDVAALITVAPAIRFFEPSFQRPPCPWLVIQGEADEIVSAADVRQWVKALDPPPVLDSHAGVGHFYHGALGSLAESADAFYANLDRDAAARRAG